MTTDTLWGLLTIAAFLMIWVSAAVAFAFTRTLRNNDYVTAAVPVGRQPEALRKLRAGESLSADDDELARHVLAARGSPLAFAIPATLFFLGCFFVFGSLEQLHGHPPSERTFLGIVPMLTATNISIQLLKSAAVQRRLRAPTRQIRRTTCPPPE